MRASLVRSGGLAAGLLSRRGLHSSSVVLGKVVPFMLPDIGEGIAEVEVLQWHVKAGDRVSQFDKLLEVQSDKATVDITSRFDGTIRALRYKKGEMAKTGTALLEIELEGEGEGAGAGAAPATAPAAAPATAPAAAPASAPSAAPASAHVRGIAAPAVRRIVREHSLLLGDIAGSGKDGRVTKEDVLRHVETGGTASPAAPAAAAAHAPAATVSETRTLLRGYGRAMVKAMTTSWVAPHFGYCEEVSMDALMAVRAATAAGAAERGVKLTYLPFLLKATSLALADFPVLNSRLSADGREVLYRQAHNIGVAMDTPSGLVVPVLQDVQGASVWKLAREMARLQAAAANNKLGEADLSGATFTLSNIGTIGGTYASPIIPANTAVIGALGKITKLPRYASTLPGARKAAHGEEDALVPVHIMTVSWAADHRFVDGATIARFTRRWKELIEAPAAMLVEMR